MTEQPGNMNDIERSSMYSRIEECEHDMQCLWWFSVLGWALVGGWFFWWLLK